MCILLKFDSVKFGVSNSCFSNVIEEKPLGVGPLVQERLMKNALAIILSRKFCPSGHQAKVKVVKGTCFRNLNEQS